MAKDWAKAFYNSEVWQKQRNYILKRDRYTCTESGCFQRATEVHHIRELTEQNIGDPNIALSERNLRSLCSECHKRITKAEHGSMEGIRSIERVLSFDEDGNPVETPPPNNRSGRG